MKFLLCPGAQKAGTTSLYHHFVGHPQIALARKKESRYFINTPKDVISCEDYMVKFFPHAGVEPVCCDVDPEYMYDPEVPERIAMTLGERARFVFMLRNPADRAYSQHLMSVRRGFEKLPFEQAIAAEQDRLAQKDPFNLAHFSYLDRGRYAKQIKRFLDVYPLSAMHFVLFEDFAADWRKTLEGVCSFAGVDPAMLPEGRNKVKNKGGLPKSGFLAKLRGERMFLKDMVKPFMPDTLRFKITGLIDEYNVSSRRPEKMSHEIRNRLIRQYQSDNHELEDIIGKKLYMWCVDNSS